MSTPFESAQLNLQLFEMRREPVLREGRTWVLNEFNPQSFAELVTLAGGDRNSTFRMVYGYWDMAASMVTGGAIDAAAFLAAHGEIFLTFAKLEPFLAELRAATGEARFCTHIETVVMNAPDAAATLARRRAAAMAAAGASRRRTQMDADRIHAAEDNVGGAAS
jgi:hypothetical protein